MARTASPSAMVILKLDFADWKEVFEEELGEQVRSLVKRLLEQALEAERDCYLDLGYYVHDPQCGPIVV